MSLIGDLHSALDRRTRRHVIDDVDPGSRIIGTAGRHVQQADADPRTTIVPVDRGRTGGEEGHADRGRQGQQRRDATERHLPRTQSA
jgi:hypothetical protein